MARFRKKPVVIDAIQFTDDNWNSVFAWADGICSDTPPMRYFGNDELENEQAWILIETLEGTHKASVGDWIICGIKGEFYPCKPDIFEETYEAVDDHQA